MRSYLLLLLLVPVACLCLPSSSQAQEVKWRYDYTAARKEAEQRGLPLMLDFGTANCFWCRKLEETTFVDPNVSKAMNERFVPLKIDADREPKLTQDLGITSYPTLVFASPDGKIIDLKMAANGGTTPFIVGYQDTAKFTESLNRVLATVVNPEWMQRDILAAQKAMEKNDHPRAVALLKPVMDESRGRPIYAQAAKLMGGIEGHAQGQLMKARQLNEKGQTPEAMDLLTDLVRDYAGTQTSREASEILNTLSKGPNLHVGQRQKRARELLAQAKEDFKQRQFLACMDRCELLGSSYGDMPEGLEGIQLANEIKNNTEWIQTACDTLSDRLSGMYLSMAETWVRKGQPQQAVICLERIVRVFPGSRQAEQAQVRLDQLQGQTTRRVEFQKQ